MAFCWGNSPPIGEWAAMASSPLSTILGGGGCGCFMPGRETLARDHNAPPHPTATQSTHNFNFNLHTTFLRDYMFSRWFRFWLKNKVRMGMRFYLLPWEQGWMKMFHGSAAASSPLAHVRAWTCSLAVYASEWTYTANVYTRVCARGCALCRCRTCARGAASAGAFPLWKDIVLYAERSARLRERIGPEEAFTSGLLVLWFIWRCDGEAALISQRIS